MGVLLLNLSGPLQAWGDSSRFTVRRTRREPTKSGVIGLVAAALGRTRDQSLDDLCKLEFGVRIDQPGEMMRDFQTARTAAGDSMPLSHRYYLADAKFLAAFGGPQDVLDSIADAFCHPVWPPYLGRRSCPADVPIVHEPQNDAYSDVREALRCEPWIAASWYRRRCDRVRQDPFPDLEVACDARGGEAGESVSDVPLSFGDVRTYASRTVARFKIPNPDRVVDIKGIDDEASKQPTHDPFGVHDPMSFL